MGEMLHCAFVVVIVSTISSFTNCDEFVYLVVQCFLFLLTCHYI